MFQSLIEMNRLSSVPSIKQTQAKTNIETKK